MKGPGLRVDLDVRRVWRCAKCGRVVRALGHVTAQRCTCTSDAAQWMHLEPAVKKEPFQAPVREHLPEAWELEEASAAAAISPPESESPAKLKHPAAGIPTESAEQPASAPTVVVETVTAEIVEVVVVLPAPDRAVAPPDTRDAFGAGVDDPPQSLVAT